MITPRLKCIISNTVRYSKGKTVADIGTDHAYVPIYLVENNLCECAIASDVKKGPAAIASDNVKEKNLSDKIEVRLGSGLSVLKAGEADTIIIAGMGGILIRDIIADGIEVARNSFLILQPMNAQYELRKYLLENDFTIVSEDISVEGIKVYNHFNVTSGHQDAFKNDFDYMLPPYLVSHKYFRNLYMKKKREFTKILTGLNNSKNTDMEKYEKYSRMLKELEKYDS